MNTTYRQLRHAGFSLVEIAIVLAVVAIVSGGAIAAFRAQVTYTRAAQAREQLREAREAILNFAVANQRLPCPAKMGVSTEIIDPMCDMEPKGWLPWGTLGLPSTDPWGQPLRYAVTIGLTQPGLALDTQGSLNIFVGGVNIDTPSKAVAFSVWSTGEDSSDASATTVSSSASSAASSSSSLVSKNTVIAEVAGSDDIVEWVSRYVLFGKMLAAGRTLPLTASSSSSAASSASASSAATSSTGSPS